MATVDTYVHIETPGPSGARQAFYDAVPHRYWVPSYDIDVDAYWDGQVYVPQDYVGTPKIVLALAANATTGVATVEVGTVGVANGENFDATHTSETDVDVTMPTTAYEREDVVVTLTSGPAAGDILLVRVTHVGTATNDTLAAPLLLFGCFLRYENA